MSDENTQDQEEKTQEQKAQEQIKAIYDDGYADLNGRRYRFTKMRHKDRRKVFAFMSDIIGDLKRGSLWWMESERFEAVEAIINRAVLFEGAVDGGADDQNVGHTLDKAESHWDNYPQDYVGFITMAMQVISYPFQAGQPTN